MNINRMNPGSKHHPGCLVLLIVALLVSVLSFGQAKDSVITDSTPLLTIKHLQKLEIYLDSKLLGKDVKLVMQAIDALIGEAVMERKRKQVNSKP
jgi:hypothetical protein